jgi:hypothetical protein
MDCRFAAFHPAPRAFYLAQHQVGAYVKEPPAKLCVRPELRKPESVLSRPACNEGGSTIANETTDVNN